MNPQALRRPGMPERVLQASLEPEDDALERVPVRLFARDKLQLARQMAMLSLIQHWELEHHQQTPDFPAIERFLAARYGYWDDDVEHVDPFPEAH